MWTWLCVLVEHNFMAKFHFGLMNRTALAASKSSEFELCTIKCARAAKDVLFQNCQLIWPNSQSFDWKTIFPSSNHLIMDLCSDPCPIKPRSAVCFRELTNECSPIDTIDLSVSFDLIAKCFQRCENFWWFSVNWLNAKSANTALWMESLSTAVMKSIELGSPSGASGKF